MVEIYQLRLGKGKARNKCRAMASQAPPQLKPLLHHQDMKGPSYEQEIKQKTATFSSAKAEKSYGRKKDYMAINQGNGNLNYTLSHSFCSSVIAAGDKISGRILKACPSLMYAGPKEVTISLNSIALATSF